MRRRDFIGLLSGIFAWPTVAVAQQSNVERQFQIGMISAVEPTATMLNAFRDELRARGYVEAQNLTINVRWPRGTFDHDPTAVTTLVQANVDVIVAWSTPAVIAVRKATSTIPIVMAAVGDPVGSGFVASLSRPGGNVTGVSSITSDLTTKQLGLFIQMVPGLKVIGLVTNSYNPNVALQLKRSKDAIRELGLQSRVAEARTSDEFERAFATLKADKVDGIMLLADPTVVESRKRIAELALASGLPTAFQRRENAEVGGLFSYGVNFADQFKIAAQYVDRILKGAKPAELPVEQPTQFELVINMKTAKALGLTIPSGVLAIANELIE